QLHHLFDEDVSLFVHQLVSLAGESERVFGWYQISLGGKGIRIHKYTSRLPYGFFVVFIQNLRVDTVQFLPGEKSQKFPALIQSLCDASVLRLGLSDEFLLESLSEYQILLVHGGKLILADNGRQRSRIAHLGVAGEKLVGHVLMVLSGITFADAVLH